MEGGDLGWRQDPGVELDVINQALKAAGAGVFRACRVGIARGCNRADGDQLGSVEQTGSGDITDVEHAVNINLFCARRLVPRDYNMMICAVIDVNR